MAVVVPFRAWRYNLEKVNDLQSVIAPPYDVIGTEKRKELCGRSSYNIVRADLPMSTPEDEDADSRYVRAAELIDKWKTQNVLIRDQRPTMTVVEEDFVGPDGHARTRHGILACLRLEDLASGVIFPHEETMSGPKRDRFQLMEATKMNLSPVFLLYSLPKKPILRVWEGLQDRGDPMGTVTTYENSTVRMWPTSRPELIETVSYELSQVPLYIADGHHRYETVLHYRDTRYEQGMGGGPWEYGLVYLANMEDPGLAIFGTHRLVKDLPRELIQSIPEGLESTFAVEPLPGSDDRPMETIREYLAYYEQEGKTFAFYAPSLGRAYGLRLADEKALHDAVPRGKSEAYTQLDVTILHTLILDNYLGITPEDVTEGEFVSFVKGWDEASARLQSGEFQAGFFMNPTRLDQVRSVAGVGERMPQKSTYFFPKLPTGLAFQDLFNRM